MAKIVKVTILDVYLNTNLVGKLTKKTTGALEFIYNENWLNRENPYPISQSLQLIETPHKCSGMQVPY